jgi:hypothetical protein
MTGPAEIRVTGHGQIFVADEAEVDGGWVHVEGRFRARVGANHQDVSWGPRATYSWPVGRVREIRWAQEATG